MAAGGQKEGKCLPSEPAERDAKNPFEIEASLPMITLSF